MTNERDLDRLLDLWLSEGPSEVTDRVVLDVADRIDRQPQRPAWRFSRRPTHMTSSVRWAAVLAALALMAVVGVAVLGRPSESGIVGGTPSDSAAATDTPRSHASPTPTASPEGPLGGGLILARERGTGGTLGVYTIDAGTGERTLLGTLPGSSIPSLQYAFQWATDRAHAIITGRSGRLRALDDPTAAGRAITFVCCPPTFQRAGDPDLHHWVLSPQGDRLAGLRLVGIKVPGQEGELSVDDAVVIFDAATAAVRILPAPSGTQLLAPISWSPDGTMVAVAGCRPCDSSADVDQPPTAMQHQRLFVVPVDGGSTRDLVDVTDANFGSPAWSPDGSSIAFVNADCRAGERPGFCSGPVSIQTVRLSDSRRISVAEAQEPSVPSWSPDGRLIAFSDAGGIFVMNDDGTNKVRLADGFDPRWSPDSHWLLYEVPAADFEPGDMWVVSADGGEPRPVGAYQGGAW